MKLIEHGETAEAFVQRTHAHLDLGLTEKGYAISNYNQDGCPLPGWDWSDPQVFTVGSNLADAWKQFRILLENRYESEA